MPPRIAYPLLALVAAGLVALGMVYPQGRGAVSPAPFGHRLAPVQPSIADARAAANLITGFGPATFAVPKTPAKPQPKPAGAP